MRSLVLLFCVLVSFCVCASKDYVSLFNALTFCGASAGTTALTRGMRSPYLTSMWAATTLTSCSLATLLGMDLARE